MTSPRLAVATAQGRFYSWKGERYKSVTNILSGGVPKPALVNWAAKRVAEIAVQHTDTWVCMSAPNAIDWLKRGPYRERDAAAMKGTAVHDWCEKYVLGQPIIVDDAPEEQRPYLMSFLSFLAEWHPIFEMTEASVFSRQYHWAGTLDAIVTIEREGLGRLLVDYKTNKSGIYPETALQLAAYRFADFVAMPDGSEHPMPDVDGCAALHLGPDGYQLIPLVSDYDAYRVFLYAKQVGDWMEDLGKRAVGEPIRLPQPAPRPSAPPNIAALVD